MSPDIAVYNGLIATAKHHHFESLLPKHPVLNNINADMETYHKIGSYLVHLRKEMPGYKFIFFESHYMILKHIEGKDNVVINIDHHHDLGYGQRQGIMDVDNCANWAFSGLKSKLISKYIWIKNRTSDEGTIHSKKLDTYFDIDYSNYIDDFNLYNLPKSDKVIVCLSSPWVPKKYRPLYKLLNDIVA